MMTPKFTSPTHSSLLSSRLPYTAASSICSLWVSRVRQTQQIQNSRCFLLERTVPLSIKLAKPETGGQWLTCLPFLYHHMQLAILLTLPSKYFSLLTSLHLHCHPSCHLTTTMAWLITLHPLPFYIAGRVLFEVSFMHWKIFIEPLLCAICDRDRHVPDLLEDYLRGYDCGAYLNCNGDRKSFFEKVIFHLRSEKCIGIN